jgi:hypothetical protein
MQLLQDCRTVRSLGAEQRRLIVEAAALTGAVWLGLRILSFANLRHVLDAWARRSRSGPKSSPAAIGWAVAGVGRRFAARTCLVDALTADAMLRRQRHESVLRIGVRKTADHLRPLDGHAWVESNGVIVVGVVGDLAEYARAAWRSQLPTPSSKS